MGEAVETTKEAVVGVGRCVRRVHIGVGIIPVRRKQSFKDILSDDIYSNVEFRARGGLASLQHQTCCPKRAEGRHAFGRCGNRAKPWHNNLPNLLTTSPDLSSDFDLTALSNNNH